MAGIISTIIHCISSFLWFCSQPVYLIMYIYETNYEAISAVFLAAYFCLSYTAKAVYLLMYGLLSMIELVIVGLANSRHVFQSVGSALISLTRTVLQASVSVSQALLNYGPWIIMGMWNGAKWFYTSLAYYINWVFISTIVVLPTPSVLWEFLKASWTYLYRILGWIVHLPTEAVQTVSGALTQLISAASDLITSTLTRVFDAVFRCTDDLWQIETSFGSALTTVLEYANRKLEGLHYEMAKFGSSAFESLFVISTALLYVILCGVALAAVFLIIILIPLKFYSLYRNAMNSANTLVGLFHRALFPSEHNGQRRQGQRQPRNAEERLHWEGDVPDAENDESLLNNVRPRRRAPGFTPQPGAQVRPQPRQQHAPQPQPQDPRNVPGPSREDGRAGHAAHLPGPSGQQSWSQVTTRRSPPPPPASTPAPDGRPTTETTAAKLVKQLEEERDRHLCVVCQDNGKNMLILPCKHLCVCLQCVEEITSLPSRNARKCPLCRGPIRSYLEVYA